MICEPDQSDRKAQNLQLHGVFYEVFMIQPVKTEQQHFIENILISDLTDFSHFATTSSQLIQAPPTTYLKLLLWEVSVSLQLSVCGNFEGRRKPDALCGSACLVPRSWSLCPAVVSHTTGTGSVVTLTCHFTCPSILPAQYYLFRPVCLSYVTRCFLSAAVPLNLSAAQRCS